MVHRQPLKPLGSWRVMRAFAFALFLSSAMKYQKASPNGEMADSSVATRVFFIAESVVLLRDLAGHRQCPTSSDLGGLVLKCLFASSIALLPVWLLLLLADVHARDNVCLLVWMQSCILSHYFVALSCNLFLKSAISLLSVALVLRLRSKQMAKAVSCSFPVAV